MKKKILFMFLISFSFVSVVFAIEDYKTYSMSEFVSHVAADTNTNENDVYTFTSNSGAQIKVTYDANENTVMQSLDVLDGNTEEEKIANSWLLEQVLGLSSMYTTSQSTYSIQNLIAANWKSGTGDNPYCDLENTGVCYESSVGKEIITIELSNKTARYIFETYNSGSGTGELQPDDPIDPPAEDPGQKASVDPETLQEGGNPDTGSFAQYGIIALFTIALVFILKIMKKNEIRYKI